MQWRELSISGAWVTTPRQFEDPRGVFLELFKLTELRDAVGRALHVQQTNLSTSAAGVVRGVHFADTPPGQAKYVTCVRGAVLDVVVDVRVGSPTFGAWDAVILDDVERRAVFLSEGLGHAFCSLEDGSTVVYLCSTPYAPEREHGINPLDPEIGIEWPAAARDGSPLQLRLSEKDAAAATLAEARALGILPTAESVRRHLDSLVREERD